MTFTDYWGAIRDLGPQILVDIPMTDYLAALALVFAGLVIAKLVYVLLSSFLDLIRFDRIAEKLGAYSLASAGTRQTPSRLLARVVYWFILVFSFAAATSVLQVVDVPHRTESIAGLFARTFSFFLILLVGDLCGRLGGSSAGAVLRLVDHPIAAHAKRPIHIFIFTAVALTNLDVLGIDLARPADMILATLTGVVASAGAVRWILGAVKRREVAIRFVARYRVGDRVSLPDGRTAVVRLIAEDHLMAAVDDEEWALPAAWMLDSPVRKENL